MNPTVRDFFRPLEILHVGCFADLPIPYPPGQPTPRDFIEFADAELAQAKPNDKISRPKLANALSHAERALAAHLDHFFYCYGLSAFTAQHKWGIARKLSFLADLGLLRDRILHKVNVARNDLEHRYQLPSYDTATNAVDIVALFIEATERHVQYTHLDVEIFHAKERIIPVATLNTLGYRDNALTIKLDRKCASISVGGKVSGVEVAESITLADSQEDFLFLFTMLLNSDRLHDQTVTKHFAKLRYYTF